MLKRNLAAFFVFVIYCILSSNNLNTATWLWINQWIMFMSYRSVSRWLRNDQETAYAATGQCVRGCRDHQRDSDRWSVRHGRAPGLVREPEWFAHGGHGGDRPELDTDFVRCTHRMAQVSINRRGARSRHVRIMVNTRHTKNL